MQDGKHASRSSTTTADGRSDSRSRHTGSRAARDSKMDVSLTARRNGAGSRDRLGIERLCGPHKNTAGVIKTHRAGPQQNLQASPPANARQAMARTLTYYYGVRAIVTRTRALSRFVRFEQVQDLFLFVRRNA